MKNAVIILYDPLTNMITRVKHNEFQILLNLVENYTIVSLKTKERVLFFKVEENEKEYIDFLMEHSNTPVSYLKNFKHAQYDIKENK